MAHTGIASTEQYNYEIIKKFSVMALIWGVLGMATGVYLAAELAWPVLNFDIPAITFGRLRLRQPALSLIHISEPTRQDTRSRMPSSA